MSQQFFKAKGNVGNADAAQSVHDALISLGGKAQQMSQVTKNPVIAAAASLIFKSTEKLQELRSKPQLSDMKEKIQSMHNAADEAPAPINQNTHSL